MKNYSIVLIDLLIWGISSPDTPSGRLSSNLGLDLNKPTNNIQEGKYTRQKEKGFKLFWIGIDSYDFLYQGMQAHLKILDELEFSYTYVESDGGRTWSNWRRYMLQFTPHLFKN